MSADRTDDPEEGDRSEGAQRVGTDGLTGSNDSAENGRSSADGRAGSSDRTDRFRAAIGRLVRASPFERLLISLAALALSVGIGAAIVFVSGMATDCAQPAYGIVVVESCYDPVQVYVQLFLGAYGNPLADPFNFSVALTLQETTILVFTGLSVAVAFRAGLFNIGSQGQMVVGALATGLVVAAVAPAVPGGLVGSLALVPLGLLAGAAFGGAYGAIPGALKAYAEANEVITTIMLNFVASLVAFVLVSEYFQAPGQAVQTAELPGYAVFRSVLFGAGSDFSLLALAFGLVLVGGTYYLLEYTSVGYDFVTSGLQPEAAEYGGVNAERTIVSSMALSGALAGIGGAVWVLMIAYRWQADIPAYGFDGITVSILAGNNPLGVIPAALLFGTLKSGSIAVEFSTGVPQQLIDVLRGLIILFVAMPEFFRLLARRFPVGGREPTAVTDGGRSIDRSGSRPAGNRTDRTTDGARTTAGNRPTDDRTAGRESTSRLGDQAVRNRGARFGTPDDRGDGPTERERTGTEGRDR